MKPEPRTAVIRRLYLKERCSEAELATYFGMPRWWIREVLFYRRKSRGARRAAAWRAFSNAEPCTRAALVPSLGLRACAA